MRGKVGSISADTRYIRNWRHINHFNNVVPIQLYIFYRAHLFSSGGKKLHSTLKWQSSVDLRCHYILYYIYFNIQTNRLGINYIIKIICKYNIQGSGLIALVYIVGLLALNLWVFMKCYSKLNNEIWVVSFTLLFLLFFSKNCFQW